MFKRKLLVIIIPVLATSVLVGAGFGAWYFDSSYIRLEKSLGVKVEDKVETFGFIETSLPEDTVLFLVAPDIVDPGELLLPEYPGNV